MAPIHDAAIAGDLDGLTREIGNGVSPDLSYGQGGLVPIHLVITNNFITNKLVTTMASSMATWIIDSPASVYS